MFSLGQQMAAPRVVIPQENVLPALI